MSLHNVVGGWNGFGGIQNIFVMFEKPRMHFLSHAIFDEKFKFFF